MGAGDDRVKVVINHEEQYSLWAVDQELPRGWRAAGVSGTKVECLRYIDTVWTDMRPMSLRTAIEPESKESASPSDHEASAVEELSRPGQKVEATSLLLGTPAARLTSLDLEIVHLKFIETRSETELTFRLDRDKFSASSADRDRGAGTVHLEGELTIDKVNVRCIADIDLRTLAGTGHVQPIRG